jgi:hypothetical protein
MRTPLYKRQYWHCRSCGAMGKQYWRIEQSHHAKKRRDRCPSPDLIKDWMKPRKSETPGRSR